MPPQKENGFGEWKNYIRLSIDELKETVKTMHNELTDIKVEIAMLKVKSGVWGALAGLIPAIITFIYFWIRGK